MTPVETLKEARSTIADPARWTQQFFARDAQGRLVGPRSVTACCWCALGAVQKAAGDDENPLAVAACNLLYATFREPQSIATFNDNHTHAEVLDLFDRAIAAGESGQ